MAPSLKARVMLSLAYGCGMRAGEVVRLKVGDIDSDQEIIRIVQSKGRDEKLCFTRKFRIKPRSVATRTCFVENLHAAGQESRLG
ncbi:MAG: tyrosine-type recombinase/integrase, partial [Rhodobacterales bacterium]